MYVSAHTEEMPKQLAQVNFPRVVGKVAGTEEEKCVLSSSSARVVPAIVVRFLLNLSLYWRRQDASETWRGFEQKVLGIDAGVDCVYSCL